MLWHDDKHINTSLPKAILLILAILAMLPIAAAWQELVGSVQEKLHGAATAATKQHSSRATELKEQIADLKAEIERLERKVEED